MSPERGASPRPLTPGQLWGGVSRWRAMPRAMWCSNSGADGGGQFPLRVDRDQQGTSRHAYDCADQEREWSSS